MGLKYPFSSDLEDFLNKIYLKYIPQKSSFWKYQKSKKIPSKKYDRLLVSGMIGQVEDVQTEIEKLKEHIKDDGILILTSINPFWGKLFSFSNSKTPLLYLWFIENIVDICGFQVIKSGYKMFLPVNIPILSPVLNWTIPKIPKINRFCSIQYIIAKPRLNLSPKKYSVSVVIPMFNEEDNVADCIKSVPKMGTFTEIIISDDGSTDKTLEVAKALQKRFKNLKVVSHKPNRGKVWAVKHGFDNARGDILMIWDADRTVPARELSRFYKLMSSGEAQYCHGTRMAYPMEKQAMKTLNLIGNLFFGWVYSKILGTTLTDTLCGTKVVFKKDYKKMEFGTEPWGDFDLLFGAYKLDLKIKEIPVHYKARVAGVSKMKTFRYGWVVAKMALKGLWQFKVQTFFKNNFLLLFILLIATATRFIGLIPNLPFHPDEGYIQKASQELFLNIVTKGDFEPHAYKYGSLIIYLQALVYLPFFVLTYLLKFLSLLTLNTSYQNLSFIDFFSKLIYDFRDTIFWAQRAVNATFGIASVYLIFLIGKKLFVKNVGLLAAFSLAIAPLHVRDSHYITTDISSLFFILLALLFMINMFQTSKLKWYVLAGIVCGISATVRYFPIAFLVYPIASLYDPKKNKIWFLKIIVGLLFLALGALIGVPFLPFSQESQKIFNSEMENLVLPFYGTSISAFATNLVSFIITFGKTPFPDIASLHPGKLIPFHASYIFHTAFGQILTYLALAGITIALVKSFKKTLFLLIIPVANFIYISFYMHAVYQRLSIPILPFLAIFAAISLFLIWQLLNKFVKGLGGKLFFIIILAAVFYQPTITSFSSAIACSQPSVYKLGNAWIDRNIDVKAKISFQPGISFPSKSYSNLKEAFRPNQDFFLEEIRDMGSDYAFFNPKSLVDYFSYPIINSYFNPPPEIIKNSLVSIGNQEYVNRALLLAKISKPEMCESTEFYFYRIPLLLEPADKIILSFNFDSADQLNFWKFQEFGIEGTRAKMVFNSSVGNKGKGSIEYQWDNIVHAAPRIVSKSIPVKPKKVYTLTGWMKSFINLEPSERDGFLRFDFYNSSLELHEKNLFFEYKNDQSTILPGHSIALSKRNYGDSDWKKFTISAKSPDEAQFVTLSLQVAGSKQTGSFYFDDLEFLGP